MIIVYTPEGGAEERYDIRKLLTSEASIVASTLGMRWAEVKDGVLSDDPASLRACVWVMKKRADPPLRFGAFDPGVEELVSRWDQKEAESFITEGLKIKDASEQERRDAWRMLLRNSADPDHTQALLDEMTAEDGGPKAVPDASPTSKKRASSTSVSSPSSSASTPAPSTP